MNFHGLHRLSHFIFFIVPSWDMNFVTQIENIQYLNKLPVKKRLTKIGTDQKQCIVKKIYEHKILILTDNCNTAILPLFKSLVLVFEPKKPMIFGT